MNERIRDLLIKSGFATGYDRHQHGHWILSDTEAEKFAELIVRECVKVMYDNAIERKVPPDINQIPTHYAIAVLEHFGVNQ